MDEQNRFERLVTGISPEERQKLLKRLEKTHTDDSEEDNGPLSEPIDYQDARYDPAEKLKSEPLLFRFWLYIKSFFTSTDMVSLYNGHLVSHISKNIGKTASDIFDARKGYLRNAFYVYLQELKGSADFFRSVVSAFEDDSGRFFVFLSAILMPNVQARLDTDVDPYTIALSEEVTGDLRAKFLRKLDVILQEIPVKDRERMYGTVQSLDWLRQFCRLPFEKFLSRFTSDADSSGFGVPADSVSDELVPFCKVLCNGRRIPVVLIEALYEFCIQPEQNTGEFDLETEITRYVTDATERIALIKMFITNIPIRQITNVALHSYAWVPDPLDGCEDWFIQYKTALKKDFDQKWSRWLKERKKEQTKQSILKFLSANTLPELQNRPWAELWDGFAFHHEMSLGFLKGFYASVYPSLAKPLKILMIEGDFYQHENRVEFTDAYNELNHQGQNVNLFDDKLSSHGTVGENFEKIMKENIRTIQGKAKIDALMLSLESEANMIVAQFCAACRSMTSVLTGVLSAERNSHYDTLANISSIQGKYNSVFRQELQTVKQTIAQAYEILKDIEMQESEE